MVHEEPLESAHGLAALHAGRRAIDRLSTKRALGIANRGDCEFDLSDDGDSSAGPIHAVAHMSMGVVQSYTNRAAQGIAELERALALDQNLASARGFIGLAKFLSDAPKKPRAMFSKLCASVRATTLPMPG
jgi:hypothetical protein